MRFHLLLFAILAAGCNNEPPASVEPVVAAADQIEKPFRGTIRAKQRLGSPLNVADIVYEVSHDRIKREATTTSSLDALSGPTISGVVCKPRANEVVVYRSHQDKKRFVRLTISQYRKNFTDGAHGGFGAIYLGIPEPKRTTVTNAANHSTIEGFGCDRHILKFDDAYTAVTIETDHCPRIEVARELLELVEPNIPSSITGFPLRVRRTEVIRALRDADPQVAERYKQVLSKLAESASNKIGEALESLVEITKVDPTVPPDFAFDLSAEYTEVADLAAFEQEFKLPPAPDFD